MKKVGRPPMGITRKVSITLAKENWDWLDKAADGNSSQLLRNLVLEAKLKKISGIMEDK